MFHRGSHSTVRIESTNMTLESVKAQHIQRQTGNEMNRNTPLSKKFTHDLPSNKGRTSQLGRVGFDSSPAVQEKDREVGTLGLRELFKVAKKQLSTEIEGGRLYIQCEDTSENQREQSPLEGRKSQRCIKISPFQ